MFKKIITSFVLSFILISATASIVYAPLAANAQQKQVSHKKVKYYVFKLNNKKITISKKELHKAFYTYIAKSVGNDPKFNNDKYINKVANGFVALIDEADDYNHILRYVALCNVESNFRAGSSSGAGAKGIPQVMLSVWQPVMTKHWGITRRDYLSSITKQLYVGYKIYDIQLKKYNGNIAKVHNAYSGGHSSYHKKVMAKYKDLLKTIES